MAVGVLEIHPAATIVPVDLARAVLARVGPVLEPSTTDAGKDLVEVGFVYQEGIVLGENPAVVFVKVFCPLGQSAPGTKCTR